MTQPARNLLDQLMGKDRNKPLSQRTAQTGNPQTWKSNDVCKPYLIDFCPHDLFPNTRADIGKCPRVHSEIFKERFDADTSTEKSTLVAKYEADFLQQLRKIIEHCENRIRRARERTEAVPPEIAIPTESRAAIQRLNLEISSLVKEAERQAEQGSLTESATTMLRVGQLNLEIRQLAGEKYKAFLKGEVVCQVCGVLMSVADDPDSCQDHIRGKQHSGFDLIRKKVKELEARVVIVPEETRRGSRNAESEHSRRPSKDELYARRPQYRERSRDRRDYRERSCDRRDRRDRSRDRRDYGDSSNRYRSDAPLRRSRSISSVSDISVSSMSSVDDKREKRLST